MNVLGQAGEVLLAVRIDSDPQLRDVEATEKVTDVEAWFAGDHNGELLVGAHPFRHDPDPTADVLVAYNTGADGAIRPGAD